MLLLQVENELPEKIERLVRCEASAYQKLLMKRVEENLGSLGMTKVSLFCILVAVCLIFTREAFRFRSNTYACILGFQKFENIKKVQDQFHTVHVIGFSLQHLSSLMLITNFQARTVHNSVMELRNICNHPYLSQLHAEEACHFSAYGICPFLLG